MTPIFAALMGAALFLCIGAVIGYGLAVLVSGGWLGVLVCFVGSVVLLAEAATCIRDGNRAGDGGMGDVLLGLILIVVVIGLWVGFGVWDFHGWPL